MINFIFEFNFPKEDKQKPTNQGESKQNQDHSLADDEKRINSINKTILGHERFEFGTDRAPSKIEQSDPSKLNLDKIEDFLKFLSLLLDRQQAAMNFLERMPDQRKQELKTRYAHLGEQLRLLDEKFYDND